VRVLWFVICLLVASAFAAETVDSATVNPTNSFRESVPLPHQTAYLAQGISVGFAGGVVVPTEKCDCLGMWQGQAEYFYTDFLSMGADVRFFGGNLDEDKMLMYQRYRVSARAHLAFSSFDIYLSPMLGMENTNLEEFREEWDNRKNYRQRDGSVDEADSVEYEENCEKMFSLDGFSIGIDAGFGWRFSKYFGVMGSSLYEYNFKGAKMLTLTPGAAFDLRRVWPWAGKRLRSTWIYVEFMMQRYFDRGVSNWLSARVVGLQIGI